MNAYLRVERRLRNILTKCGQTEVDHLVDRRLGVLCAFDTRRGLQNRRQALRTRIAASSQFCT